MRLNMRGRILRLEKRAGVRVDDPDALTDSELIAGLRTMFRADPARRWEEALPALGYGLSQVLAEARAPTLAGCGT